MRRWALLIAAGAAVAGCKAFDRDRPARTRDGATADPASRTRPRGGPDWLDGPSPGPDAKAPRDRTGVPAADTWDDPRNPAFDVGRASRRMLDGYVVDPDGQKVKDVYVAVAKAAAPAAEVEYPVDRSGHFLIRGLDPDTPYVLTVRTKRDGQDLAGRVYVKTGQSRSVPIRLVDGLRLDPTPGGGAGGPPATPAGGGPELPAPVLQPGGPGASAGGGSDRPGLPEPKPRDGEWSVTNPGRPGGGSTQPGTPPPVPPAPQPPPRAELTTTIPNPQVPAAGGQSQSRAVKPGAGFTLLDPTGDPRAVPTGRPGELVLLEFLTTGCVPCRKAIPAVRELQADFAARGLEVIGVVCDAGTPAERRQKAGGYADEHRLNYLLYTEPGQEAGALNRRYGVQAYPTLVLLDAAGEMVWKGSPDDADKLRRVIADEFARTGR